MTNPLKTAKFEDEPCLALAATQASELGVGHPGVERTLSGNDKACLWSNDNGGQIDILWTTSNGLDGVYQANEQGRYDLFEEIPDIGGLPAVVASQLDLREDGSCNVWVGTSDQAMFMLGLRQSGDKIGTADPCSVAAEVANRVVTTMKGA